MVVHHHDADFLHLSAPLHDWSCLPCLHIILFPEWPPGAGRTHVSVAPLPILVLCRSEPPIMRALYFMISKPMPRVSGRAFGNPRPLSLMRSFTAPFLAESEITTRVA